MPASEQKLTCGGEGQKNCQLLEQGLRFRGRHGSAENGGGLLMDERSTRGGPVRPEPADDVSSNSIGSDTASRFPFRTGNSAALSAEELDDPSESRTHPDRAGEVRSPAWTAEPAVTPTATMLA